MGRKTDARKSIQPATSERLAVLHELSDLAVQLIRSVALEASGIRYGDGGRHDANALDAVVQEIARLYATIDEVRAVASPGRLREMVDELLSFATTDSISRADRINALEEIE